MLRRTANVNLPAHTKYLAVHFPDIQNKWRETIVVATFTAAHKVAVTHADDDRRRCRKKAMTRWLHGLSAAEPYHLGTCTDTGSEATSASSSALEAYSPSTNFLMDWYLLVPLRSYFLRRQLEQDLQITDGEISEVAPEAASAVQPNLGSDTSTAQVGEITEISTEVAAAVDAVMSSVTDGKAISNRESSTSTVVDGRFQRHYR